MQEFQKPRAIALGYFDGVHLGHQALMARAVERARQIGGTSAVFTFDVHPDSVVLGRQVPLLTANAYRREEIKQLGGVDEVIFGHFNEQMQHMDWRDFIHKMLIGRFGARWIISGRNNRFGYKGQGNAEGMAAECEKAGIGYDCIEDVKVDGIVVSSTYIRQLISQGDMEGAARFLGHPYTVTGVVEHGRRVGTSVLRVPTVNLALPPEMALPPYGVYATRVLVGDKRYVAADQHRRQAHVRRRRRADHRAAPARLCGRPVRQDDPLWSCTNSSGRRCSLNRRGAARGDRAEHQRNARLFCRTEKRLRNLSLSIETTVSIERDVPSIRSDTSKRDKSSDLRNFCPDWYKIRGSRPRPHSLGLRPIHLVPPVFMKAAVPPLLSV